MEAKIETPMRVLQPGASSPNLSMNAVWTCVIVGPTRGHRWSESAARLELHRTAIRAGVRRRFAPHQLRHAHAVELLHEGISLPLIQRQLGHSHLSTTGTYLQGISSEEIISTVHARRAPMMHASAGLAL